MNKEYIQNIYYKISESYILDRYDERFEQVDLDILDINFTKNLGFTRCPNIIKIQQIKNYIVGYSLGEENITSFEEQKYKTKKFCKGYFYINYDNENEAKFNLTKEEIKNKFPGKIKYLKAQKFLNLYGEGNIGQPKEVAIVGIFLWTIIIIFLIIIIKLILKYI